MADYTLSAAEQQQIRNSFLRSLKKVKPSVSVTPNDARRGGTFVDVQVGAVKGAIASSNGRQLRAETGNFL